MILITQTSRKLTFYIEKKNGKLYLSGVFIFLDFVITEKDNILFL